MYVCVLREDRQNRTNVSKREGGQGVCEEKVCECVCESCIVQKVKRERCMYVCVCVCGKQVKYVVI